MQTLADTAFERLTGAGYLRCREDNVIARRVWRAMFGDECLFCGRVMGFRTARKLSSKAVWKIVDNADRQATVDHIDCRGLGGGHEVSNIQIICWRCNLAKSKAENSIVRRERGVVA